MVAKSMGEWLRQWRPKRCPIRSAQQSKTEIEQIPDKLEFGLVFLLLLLFSCLLFFGLLVSLLISFALPAKFPHIFLIVVFAVLLCFSCRCFCNISTQDFVSNMRWLL